MSYDISGHIFLLTFSLAVINEECQVLRKMPQLLDSMENGHTGATSLYRMFLSLAMLLLVLLTALWAVMIIATALYFHNVSEKLLGMVAAIVGWFVIYKVFHLSGTV